MIRITPVVRQLLIINVVFFFIVYTIFPNYADILSLQYPTSGRFQPFQLVSNIFMHADLSHLLFNMVSLFFLGPWLESKLRAEKFLALYLSSGVMGVVAHFSMIYIGINPPVGVLGASGAVLGVLAALAFYFPHEKIQLIFPPIPIKIGHLALFLIAIDLFSGVSRTGDGIAHFAHLGGAFCGLALAFYFQKNDNSFRKN